MLSAEPWLKIVSSTGSKEDSVRPSKPGPKTISGFADVQVPKSSVLEMDAVALAVAAVAAVEAAVVDTEIAPLAAVVPVAAATPEEKLVTLAAA